MAKGIFKDVIQPPTLQQRLGSNMIVSLVGKAENLPLTPDKLGYYYAALADKKPDPSKTPDPILLKVARALVWADYKARLYRSRCLPWYPLLADAFPEDDRCAFYVAALCFHEILTVEASEQERFWGNLMRPSWQDSPLWSKLDLPRNELLKRLIDSFSDAAEIRITPERLPILEAAFESASLSDKQRLTTARWLAVAYRASGRSDDRAEIIYRYLFLQDPDDTINNAYLANLFVGRSLADGNASVVYARMIAQTEKEQNKEAQAAWSARLARIYVSQGRLGVDAIQPLQVALLQAKDDRLLEAALAYSIGKSDIVLHDPSLLKHLETAIAFETEFVPYFTEHQWQWALVPRALALGWGRLGRRDSLALFIYARATELCPEEKSLWGYYASALAESKDYSIRAVSVYERAQRYQLVDDKIQYALANAYLANRVHESGERRKAVALWESLYHKGQAAPELLDALVDCYIREERLSEAALELLQKVTESIRVAGPLRLRIAQEWRKREDISRAVTWYQSALEAQPDHFTTLFEYGSVLKENLSDFANAAKLLAKAVSCPAGEQSLEAHSLLGESLLGLERREDARRVFQVIIDRIDPNHTPTLLQLARLNLKYEIQGMVKAETLYERAAALDPNNPETFKQMAELYQAQGNTRMEQWALEQHLKNGTQDADQYRQLADLYIRRREFEKAEGALRRVIALGQGNREVYTLLGDIIQQIQKVA